jgi:hypothetical protein
MGKVHMTAVETTSSSVAAEDADLVESAGKNHSARGGFEIYTAPELQRPPAPEQLTEAELLEQADMFDYSALVDDEHGEDEVRASVADMIRAITPGNIVNFLFNQDGENGMSLVHAWFGPNFPLFRHSHPRMGDCLYYIVAGQAILGSRTLNPGDGFFVPNGMPYKYRAGPEGVEILEFRAGGGIEDAPIIKLHEPSVDAIQRITSAATRLRDDWQDTPARVGETGHSPNSAS